MGHNDHTMIGFLVLLFPLLLMAFMLGMERIEKPLTRSAVERDVEDFLDNANPDELDTFVREGTDSAIKRFRTRIRLPGTGRRNRVQ
ncbi:hypothetical protein BH10ACT8_BH10ACT8_30410 [soil metagenome]|jgi:hypothetical protein